MRPETIDDRPPVAPGGDLVAGGVDDQPEQLQERDLAARNRDRTGLGPRRQMRRGQEPVARDGRERGRVTGAFERQRLVDHGEARPDQEDALVGKDGPHAVVRPRVGNQVVAHRAGRSKTHRRESRGWPLPRQSAGRARLEALAARGADQIAAVGLLQVDGGALEHLDAHARRAPRRSPGAGSRGHSGRRGGAGQ